MRIKKFSNLWAMGLILCVAILITLYAAKMIFPQFVVGVAQYEPIVKFGNFVDSHLIMYYIYNGITSYILGFFYLCACCRIPKLDLKGNILVIAYVIVSFIVQGFLAQYSVHINLLLMLALPCVYLFWIKAETTNKIYSICTTLIVHSFAQILSLEIRSLNTMIAYPNSATYSILLIDMYIWLFLLYSYYNYKEVK